MRKSRLNIRWAVHNLVNYDKFAFRFIFVLFFFWFRLSLNFYKVDRFYGRVTFPMVLYRPICNIAEKPGYIFFSLIAL